MKKAIFALLISLVLITASCSISAGIPWIWGGWGFFADIGVGFSAAHDGEMAQEGFLNINEQNGKDLAGTLAIGGNSFEVRGTCLGNGEIVLNLFQDGVLSKTLNGNVTAETMTGSDWHAVKAE